MPINPTQSLTPTIKTPTTVPFPDRPKPVKGQPASNAYSPQLGAAAGKSITVETCSETIKRKLPLDLFSVRSDDRADGLSMIHDQSGQPVVFSVGSDHHLYMLAFVNNAIDGWQKFDMTPSFAGNRKFLVDFDVIMFNSDVYVCIAIPSTDKVASDTKSEDVVHSIWYCKFPMFQLSTSPNSSLVTGFNTQDLKWIEVKNNLGAKHISTVVCGTGMPIEGSPASGVWVGVGTGATQTQRTSNYIVDLSSDAAAPWEAIPTIVPSDESKYMCPITMGSIQDQKRRPGIASLLKRSAGGSSGIFVDKFTGLQRVRVPNALLPGTLGDVASFTASLTVFEAHDIYAAGTGGIGYYSFDALEAEPRILLPGISMREVSCAEVLGDKADTDRNVSARISLLAVSTDHDLYFIQGVRKLDDGLVSFDTYSGLPIRRNIQKISVQYNSGCRSTEVLYVSKDRPNELQHLARDPHTTIWSDTKIAIRRPPGEKPTFIERSVHVTTITLTDGNGHPVPDEYPIMITGSRMAITVGTNSVFLSERNTIIRTYGGNGQIVIVAAAEDIFGASEYHIELTELIATDLTSTKLTVQPCQRALHLMSGVGSTDDLKNVTDNKGNPVFAGVDDEKLSKMAGVVGAANAATSDSSHQSSTPLTVTTKGPNNDPLLFNPPASNTSHRMLGGLVDWLGKAIDSTVHFFGDVIEAIKQGVKTIVRVGLQILGTALKFVVEIAGKIISFAMKGVSLVLKGVSSCLKLIGVDTSKLDNWLSYLFDGTATLETQKVLNKAVKGCITISQKFLSVNQNSVQDLFTDGKKFLKKFIDDPRGPNEKAEGQKDSVFTKILNNPIVKAILDFNPLSWLVDAIADGMDAAKFKTPDLAKFIKTIADKIGSGAEDLITALEALANTIGDSIGELASDPSQALSILGKAVKKVFWTIFEAVEKLALNIYQVLTAVFGIIVEFLEGEWEIPGLTDGWEEFTGQKFTLLGFGTYICAAIMNLGSMIAVGHLPFKDIQSFDEWDDLKVPQLFKSSSTVSHRKMMSQPPDFTQDIHEVEDSKEEHGFAAASNDSSIPTSTDISHPTLNADAKRGGQILHREATKPTTSLSSAHDAKVRKLWASIFGVIGEAFTFLAAAKEIFHLIDFSSQLGSSTKSSGTLPNVRPNTTKPSTSALSILYNISHLAAFTFAIVSTSCNIAYTVIRYNDDPPVPRGGLAFSVCISLLGCGFFAYKFDAGGGMLLNAANGASIISEWCNEDVFTRDKWPEAALSVTRFISACTGFVGIIAADLKLEQVAVICGAGDLALSAIGGVGETVEAITHYNAH